MQEVIFRRLKRAQKEMTEKDEGGGKDVATDQKAGALVTHMDFLSLPFLNHRFEVRGGVLEKSCSKLLSSFFRKLRQG